MSDPIGSGPPDWADELQSWLAENWEPDLTVGEWWDRLGMSGWSAPLLPADALRARAQPG